MVAPEKGYVDDVRTRPNMLTVYLIDSFKKE